MWDCNHNTSFYSKLIKGPEKLKYFSIPKHWLTLNPKQGVGACDTPRWPPKALFNVSRNGDTWGTPFRTLHFILSFGPGKLKYFLSRNMCIKPKAGGCLGPPPRWQPETLFDVSRYGDTWGPRHGGEGGILYSIQLRPDETIIGTKVFYSDQINSIQGPTL